jgi:hypothetical protein
MTKVSHTVLALQLEVHFKNLKKLDEWTEVQTCGKDYAEAVMIGWRLLAARRKGPRGSDMRIR